MQDKLLVLSENQALSASAASDFYIDGGAISNPGQPFILEVVVTKAFTGASGSLTVSVEVGNDANFTQKTTLATSAAVEAADLKTVGTRIMVPVPYNADRTKPNLRAYYTVDTVTGGTVTAVLQPRVFTNVYPTFGKD